jgi:ArsR family transcriptional regulator
MTQPPMDIARVVQSAKGLADPTRLRLLALLGQGELTVGEISRVLGHSQPRVSRHLRLLSEAGFLDRFRDKQCVYYRAPPAGAQAPWLRELLAAIDPEDPELQRDRARLSLVVGERASPATRVRKRAAELSP